MIEWEGLRKEGERYDERTYYDVSRHRNDKYNNGTLLSVNETRLWNLEFTIEIDRPSISSPHSYMYFFRTTSISRQEIKLE